MAFFAYAFWFCVGAAVMFAAGYTVWTHYLRNNDEAIGAFIREFLKHRPEIMPAYCPVCRDRELQNYLANLQNYLANLPTIPLEENPHDKDRTYGFDDIDDSNDGPKSGV